MSDVQRTKIYSVGIPSIDSQHRPLAELNHQLFHAIMEGRGRDMAAEAPDGPARFVDCRFSCEAKPPRECGVAPALLAVHARGHRSLTRRDKEGCSNRLDSLMFKGHCSGNLRTL